MKNVRKSKGITLVALVITIILLLILAGITINSLTGSGLFGKAQLAKEKSEEAEKKENLLLSEYESMINGYIDGSRDTVTIDKESYNNIITTLASLSNEVKALNSKLEQVESKNNSQVEIETGTYIGTGTYGSSNKNSITFSKTPKLVYLCSKEELVNPYGDKYGYSTFFTSGMAVDGSATFSFNESSDTKGSVASPLIMNWSSDGKTVYWYNKFDDNLQFNAEDSEYTWIAFYN